MADTLHYMDENPEMKEVLLDFKIFVTPHTGEETEALLMGFLVEWNFKIVRSITTDNSKNTFKAMEIILDKISSM